MFGVSLGLAVLEVIKNGGFNGRNDVSPAADQGPGVEGGNSFGPSFEMKDS